MKNVKYCFFCKRSMGLVTGANVQLSCLQHEVKVVHWFGGALEQEIAFDVHFDIEIKNKVFRVVLYPRYPNNKRTLIYVREHIKLLDMDNDKKLFDMQGIMEITPENAKTKIPIILTFS